MRVLALSVLLGVSAVFAAPAPQETEDPYDPCSPWGCETITVSDMVVTRNSTNQGVQDVYLKIQGSLGNSQIECRKKEPNTYDITRCSGTNYHFTLFPGEVNHYSLQILHQLSVGRGLSGRGDVPLNCEQNDQEQYLCTQDGTTDIIIDSKPEPTVS
jgi:hypothetical protein